MQTRAVHAGAERSGSTRSAAPDPLRQTKCESARSPTIQSPRRTARRGVTSAPSDTASLPGDPMSLFASIRNPLLAALLSLGLAGAASAADQADQPKPYPLTVCSVSGEKLG